VIDSVTGFMATGKLAAPVAPVTLRGIVFHIPRVPASQVRRLDLSTGPGDRISYIGSFTGVWFPPTRGVRR